MIQASPHLRQVGAMDGPGMQVDDMADLINNFLLEQVRHPGSQRAFLAAGKAAVKVPPVRQITGLLDKAEYVDNGNGNQSPAQPANGRHGQQAPDDFNTRSEERRVGKECRSQWSPYQ